MRTRTWPVLLIAFGTFLVLIALAGFATQRRTRQIYAEISALNDRYQRTQSILNEVRTEIHLSGVLVRDFLLDPSHLTADLYREELLEIRNSMSVELKDLSLLMGPEDVPKLKSLEEELDLYWDSLEPLFEWSPRQKLAYSSIFLRTLVLPRRDAALGLARELRELNQANVERQRQRIDATQSALPIFLGRLLALTMFLGLLVAAGSIFRVKRLERESELEWERAERAEEELRRLSQQLVQAQEEERRVISRELHDEVGQMLTALRMELRNLEMLRTGSEEQFLAHHEDARQLAERALRVVRDLAMGLRPAMLDDLGLGPALEWQARQFSRRFGVPVTVQLDGSFDQLPDTHRTCVYRIVQEALTNCGRHAHASEVRVAVQGREEVVTLTIQDDGAGFDASPEAPRTGFGLIGIQERVRELGGKFKILSQPEKGTVLNAEIPIRQDSVKEIAAK